MLSVSFLCFHRQYWNYQRRFFGTNLNNILRLKSFSSRRNAIEMNAMANMSLPPFPALSQQHWTGATFLSRLNLRRVPSFQRWRKFDLETISEHCSTWNIYANLKRVAEGQGRIKLFMGLGLDDIQKPILILIVVLKIYDICYEKQIHQQAFTTCAAVQTFKWHIFWI